MARDLKHLANALQKLLPSKDSVKGLVPLTHGHSNETYVIEGPDLILRLPPSGEPLLRPYNVHGAVAQGEILAELRGRDAGIPLPRVLMTVRDRGVLGDPFIIMTRSAGEAWPDWCAPDWVAEMDEAQRPSVSEQLIALYGTLHMQKPLSAIGGLTSSIDELQRWWQPVRDIANQDLREGVRALLENPPIDGEPAPCHGDARLPNLLWSNGRLTAILDWEMAFNGDPRWDLANILHYFDSPEHPGLPGYDTPGLWRRDRMIAAWEQATGRKARMLEWYEAAAIVRHASIMTYGDGLWNSGKVTDRRLGMWGDAIKQSSRTVLRLSRKIPSDG